MIKENNIVKTSNIPDKNFFKLVSGHWKEWPSLFKGRIVREVYDECHSLRKTARILDVSKTTVYHYVKKKQSPLSCTASTNEIAVDFSKPTLLLLIQQIHDETSLPPKSSAGNDDTVLR